MYPNKNNFSSISSVCKDILWYLATYLLLSFHKIFFGLKIEKNKKAKEIKSGYISICNHVHYLDCAMVANALGNRRSYYPTLESNLHFPVIGPLIQILGGIPIPCGIKELSAFSEHISSILQKNRGVHIFPEGELVPYCEKLRTMKSGAFHFAATNRVPLVPLAITYRNAKGLRRLTNRKPLLTISVLDPIFPDQEGSVKDQIRRLSSQAQKRMKEKIEYTQ